MNNGCIENNESQSESSGFAKKSIWYLLNVLVGMVFPFAAGIYVAHVLPKDNIGIVSAAQNLAQYFVILAFLGIPTYGMKEVAKARFNRNKLNKLFTELFTINLVSTILFSIVYYLIIFMVPIYREYVQLYSIAGIAIIFNAVNICWLYDGLEKFKFTSILNLLFKIISFIFLVLFVKNQNDSYLYCFLLVISTYGVYFIYMLFSQKYAKFSFKNFSIRRHIKPIIALVVVNLAIEIYSLVDITMLNIYYPGEIVTNYKYGSSIAKILLQVVNSFTIVLIPNLTVLYVNGQKDEFNALLSKVFGLIIWLSLPIIVGVYFVSPFVFISIYGESFINASKVLRVMSPIIFVAPIGYLLGSRVLLISNNEKKMIIPVAIGAIINVTGNAILIPFFQEIGASIASLLSEICVAVIYILLGKKIFKMTFNFKNYLKIFIAVLLMLLSLGVIDYVIENQVLKFFVEVVSGIVFYYGSCSILREDNTISFFKMVFKLRKKDS